jgi:hypothetical protein
MNWKGCVWEQSLPNLRYCPRIYLDGLRKLTEICSPGSPAPNGDLNPGFPEFGNVTNHLTKKSARSSRRKCYGKVKGKGKEISLVGWLF